MPLGEARRFAAVDLREQTK